MQESLRLYGETAASRVASRTEVITHIRERQRSNRGRARVGDSSGSFSAREVQIRWIKGEEERV